MASGMTSQPQGKSAADVQQRKSMQMLLLGAGGMMGFFLLGLGHVSVQLGEFRAGET